MTEKQREQRARTMLKRAGESLVKSKSNKINIDNMGGYRIVDMQSNIVSAGEKVDLSLEEVERYIREE